MCVTKMLHLGNLVLCFCSSFLALYDEFSHLGSSLQRCLPSQYS